MDVPKLAVDTLTKLHKKVFGSMDVEVKVPENLLPFRGVSVGERNVAILCVGVPVENENDYARQMYSRGICAKFDSHPQ